MTTAPVARPGWVKVVALVVLAAGGGVGGLYLSGALADAPALPPSEATLVAVALPAGPAAPVRFPLSARDVKDGVEAPSLAADAAGAVHLAWASQTGEAERTVMLTKSADGGRGFAPPRAVATTGIYKSVAAMKGKTVTRELRCTPHLAVAGSSLHLAWTEALPGNTGVRLVLATSADGGAAFTTPMPVHAGPARPTFTALAVGPGGALAASWLDNRGKTQQTFAAVRPAGAPAFAAEAMVYGGPDDKGVCPCCPTAAAFAPDGTLYVAFRNVSNGHRDIAVGRLAPGAAAFDGPFPVVPDTWKFDGCPHDGPSLAVVGDTLHVVWMDARGGPQRCYYASAPRATMAFAARELSPIPSGTQGNAKLRADAAGVLHAVWEEALGAAPAADPHAAHQPPALGGAGRVVRYATLPSGASAFAPARSVSPKAGAFQTRPTLVVLPDGGVVAAWNELDEGGKAVVVSRVPADGDGVAR